MVEAFFVLEYNRWKEPTEMKGWTMDKCENWVAVNVTSSWLAAGRVCIRILFDNAISGKLYTVKWGDGCDLWTEKKHVEGCDYGLT
jgi:hypothetical protein